MPLQKEYNKLNAQKPRNPQSTLKPQQKKTKEFNIILQRKVEVKRFPIIAELEFKRERLDLVSLLKSMQQNATTMPRRLITYLKREGLWDSEIDSLTKKAQEVVNTGLINMKERGLYHIWYAHNDPLLGTRPLFIQRDNAFFEPKAQSWKVGTDAKNSEFSVSQDIPLIVDMLDEVFDGKGKKFAQHKGVLISLKPEVICSSDESTFLELKWELGFNKSLVSLQGKLEASNCNKKNQISSIHNFDFNIDDYLYNLDEVMDEVAYGFHGYWNDNARRIEVNLQDICKYSDAIQKLEINSIQIPNLNTEMGVFKRSQITYLPIKPQDDNDAYEWQKAWLFDFHKRKYQNHDDAYNCQSAWLDHEALAEFDLSIKLGQELLDCFSRESKAAAYWHVAAIADLSPSCRKKQILPITLINSDVLSLRELINQLTDGDLIQNVIYSDRYVNTKRQTENLNAIAACIGHAEGVLMTLFSSKEGYQLPQNWTKQSFKKQSDNHGRYWVFWSKTYTWCWECTSGLDFIQCNGNDHFIVDGTPTFTPKEEAELPLFLQNMIKNIKSVEVM